MAWGTIELEQEVEEWLLALPDELFGQAERYIDLLAAEGVHLDEPFTRQLRGKLRELRFTSAASRRGSPTTSPPAARSCCSPCS
ncbi:MAG: type II toxin-antitoxin system RelE/ParE family toxin [Acidimicrobiales bacterium]|jgi:hypothetical protein